VIRSSPRGVALPPLTEANLAPMKADPRTDAVQFDGVRLTVPE